MSPQTAPYGSWKSPVTLDLALVRSLQMLRAQIAVDGDDVYWDEPRPQAGGRYVLMRRTPAGRVTEITPPGFNVRTRVHEYGGGAFAIADGTLYFSNFSDQRLYRQRLGGEPQPITPAKEYFYADGVIDQPRRRMICVREDHTPADREAVNAIVAVNVEGDEAGGRILVSGNDFYASPRLSPEGSRLAWLTWNHPNLPWDGTEVWVGELNAEGSVGRARRVAGGKAESVFQPEWSPDGVLHFVSDRSGWWNLCRWRAGKVEALCPMEAEFGRAQWQFGMSTYAFASAERIICAYNVRGFWKLSSLDTATGKLDPIETPYTAIYGLRAARGGVLFVAASPTEHAVVARLDPAARQFEVLRRLSDAAVDPGYLSLPQAIEFLTENGLTAHAFFYPPRNRDFAAPPGEKPPLIVVSHGGPTSAAAPVLNLEHQFWTSRGFAVVDVNYGGSTGFGRAYWQRLAGQWGVVDMDDCVNAARYLAAQGWADDRRLAITGGSAGGYTTLCALTFRDTFRAGASHFGISDLEVFARDTHKFESRYMDSLVGPYPARRDLYHARSPIHFLDRLACPLILFQGLEDRIVPPNQAEMMFEAVKKKGLPVAYLPFPGEQHGFRRAENIKRTMEAELYFYSRIFGFDLAEPVEPVKIENLR